MPDSSIFPYLVISKIRR